MTLMDLPTITVLTLFVILAFGDLVRPALVADVRLVGRLTRRALALAGVLS